MACKRCNMKVEAGFARRITATAKNLQVGRLCMRPSCAKAFWLCLCGKFQHGNRRHRWQPLLSLVTYIPYKDGRAADVRREDVRTADVRCEKVRTADVRCEDARSANKRWEDARAADIRCEDVRSPDIRCKQIRSAGVTCEHVPADVRCEDVRSVNMRFEDVRSAGVRCEDVRSVDLRCMHDVTWCSKCVFCKTCTTTGAVFPRWHQQLSWEWVNGEYVQ